MVTDYTLRFTRDEMFLKLHTFLRVAGPAPLIPFSAGGAEAAFEREKQVFIDYIGDASAFWKHQMDKAKALIRTQDEQIRVLENELARVNSIRNNNSTNSGATTRVDRCSVTGFRMDHTASENESDGVPGETACAPSKAPNEFNGRDAQTEADRKEGKVKKPVGGQLGHKGTALTKEDADAIIERNRSLYGIEPEIIDIGDPERPFSEKYRIGIMHMPFVKIIRYHADANGKYNVPENMNSPVAYDDTVYREMVYLRNCCNMPINKIVTYFEDSTDGLIRPSDGTISDVQGRFAKACTPSVDWIRDQLPEEPVLYTDATYVFKNGVSAFIRNISTNEMVLYIPMDRKSYEALKAIPVLPGYRGVLVHDHEVVMYHFGEEHGECIIHVMRYGRKDIEDTGHKWAEELIEFFTTAHKEKQEAQSRGEEALSPERLEYYSQWCDRLLEQGWIENRTTEHLYAKRQEATFLKRLEKYKPNHLLFLYNFEVDWSDNLSERDLRKAKRFTAVSGGFRSDPAMQNYCTNLSVLETLRKRRCNPWNVILRIFTTGENVFTAENVEETA